MEPQRSVSFSSPEFTLIPDSNKFKLRNSISLGESNTRNQFKLFDQNFENQQNTNLMNLNNQANFSNSAYNLLQQDSKTYLDQFLHNDRLTQSSVDLNNYSKQPSNTMFDLKSQSSSKDWFRSAVNLNQTQDYSILQNPGFNNNSYNNFENNLKRMTKSFSSLPLTDSLPNIESSSILYKLSKFRRSSAHLIETQYIWRGELNTKCDLQSGFSQKVFLGGLPWGISEWTVKQIFSHYGNLMLDYPGRDNFISWQSKGYVYIVYENEMNVKNLLNACQKRNSSWYYTLVNSSKRKKQIEVIPWNLNNSNCTNVGLGEVSAEKTVFVGGLHGKINAKSLSQIMSDMFGDVVYAGIDTDVYKYPIGSGRVSFKDTMSYMKAISAAYVEIRSPTINKKIQIDPYLDDSYCSKCPKRGPFFCREMMCFHYFCEDCWHSHHNQIFTMQNHIPLTKNIKNEYFALPSQQQHHQSTTSSPTFAPLQVSSFFSNF